ncbi:hypothetical protein K3495_g15223, partial [Podosphaera aphanis]
MAGLQRENASLTDIVNAQKVTIKGQSQLITAQASNLASIPDTLSSSLHPQPLQPTIPQAIQNPATIQMPVTENSKPFSGHQKDVYQRHAEYKTWKYKIRGRWINDSSYFPTDY